MPSPPAVAVVLTGAYGALAGPDIRFAGTAAETVRRAAALAAAGPVRWVWWAARDVVPALLEAGADVDRSWDIAEVHRLLAGGWTADPGVAWAGAHGLDPTGRPAPAGDDLFDFASESAPTRRADPDSPVRADGYLRADAVSGRWIDRPARALAWADAAAQTARAQEHLLAGEPRRRHTAWSESAAAVLCIELERDGLPLNRAIAARLIAAAAGPRPLDEADAARHRAARDAAVLAHVPGRDHTDLRSPEQVRALLAAVGIAVPDTRKHRLTAYLGVHPVVEALLAWRAAERIATTYGYHWLDTHVGGDDRLRGPWTACDGAAGRMTAQHGLHNLPAALRPAVTAEPGHLLVRADLGQVEPRVLAAVSGDPAFAAASRSADLYAPIARALGVDRPTAKVAVLAAMYGQTSGSAGEALRRLTRSYPIALDYLDRAYDAGVAGVPLRTWGGRVVVAERRDEAGLSAEESQRRAAARGRFVRNAAVQGAAAELFKAWAATVRIAVRPYGARIVMCLHDELLLHTPADHAPAVAAAVEDCLASASARWSGGGAVTFVSATTIVPTWSDAKDATPADRSKGTT